MKKIRFILRDCRQVLPDKWENFYSTEIVEVSDRAYELLTGLNFLGAEKIDEEDVSE
jgi:hypothetical protein